MTRLVRPASKVRLAFDEGLLPRHALGARRRARAPGPGIAARLTPTGGADVGPGSTRLARLSASAGRLFGSGDPPRARHRAAGSHASMAGPSARGRLPPPGGPKLAFEFPQAVEITRSAEINISKDFNARRTPAARRADDGDGRFRRRGLAAGGEPPGAPNARAPRAPRIRLHFPYACPRFPLLAGTFPGLPGFARGERRGEPADWTTATPGGRAGAARSSARIARRNAAPAAAARRRTACRAAFPPGSRPCSGRGAAIREPAGRRRRRRSRAAPRRPD